MRVLFLHDEVAHQHHPRPLVRGFPVQQAVQLFLVKRVLFRLFIIIQHGHPQGLVAGVLFPHFVINGQRPLPLAGQQILVANQHSVGQIVGIVLRKVFQFGESIVVLFQLPIEPELFHADGHVPSFERLDTVKRADGVLVIFPIHVNAHQLSQHVRTRGIATHHVFEHRHGLLVVPVAQVERSQHFFIIDIIRLQSHGTRQMPVTLRRVAQIQVIQPEVVKHFPRIGVDVQAMLIQNKGIIITPRQLVLDGLQIIIIKPALRLIRQALPLPGHRGRPAGRATHHGAQRATDSYKKLPHASHFFPECPKPPAPRSVSSKFSTTAHSARSYRDTTIWAIRSPSQISKGSGERFTKMTQISPR